MSLRDYIRILRSRWYVVVAATIVGVLVAGLYVGTATKKYTAKAQLFVSTNAGDNASLANLSSGGTFSQNQVKSYAAVATAPALLRKVLDATQAPYSIEQLAGEITSTAPLNTVLINLSITDSDPARAQALVNALATQMSVFIPTLQASSAAATSPVKATVTQTALRPGGKTSPKTTLDIGLGFLVGLVIGVGLAVALETLDNRVSGHQDLEGLLDAPIVGLIGEDKLAKTKPLILLDDAFSRRSESFRQLRTNIRYLGVDRLLRSFVVTGSVESEGKSLTAANLALALAQSGERVVLIDADLRRPTVAKTFGVPGAVGLTNVLVGTAKLDEALQVWRPDLPLAILPSGPLPPNPSELLGSQRLIELVKELRSGCDIVIFDSPPLLPVTDATLLARATDGAVVVTRARSTRLTQLRASVSSVRAADAHVLGVIINRIPRRRGDYGAYSYGGYHTYGSYAPIEPVEPATSTEEPASDGPTGNVSPVQGPSGQRPASPPSGFGGSGSGSGSPQGPAQGSSTSTVSTGSAGPSSWGSGQV